MGIDNALMTDNPISRARAFEAWSLEKLGKKLGLSKQYLSRAEHGTYSGINRNLARWVANVLDISVREVDRQYSAFQSEKRRLTAQNLAPALLARKNNNEAGHVIFKRWRESWWPTPLAFCKDLCVHPQSVENYEEGIITLMPNVVMDALREAKMLDPNWSEHWSEGFPLVRQRTMTDVPETEALRAALGPFQGAKGGNYFGEGRDRQGGV